MKISPKVKSFFLYILATLSLFTTIVVFLTGLQKARVIRTFDLSDSASVSFLVSSTLIVIVIKILKENFKK